MAIIREEMTHQPTGAVLTVSERTRGERRAPWEWNGWNRAARWSGWRRNDDRPRTGTLAACRHRHAADQKRHQ